MTGHELPFDIKAALEESTILITTARNNLVNTLGMYNITGRELAKTALERLPQLDPAASPKREEAAAGLTEELARFGDFWVPLAGNAGILLATLVKELNSLAVKMMSPQFPRGADIEGLDAISIVNAHANALDEAVKRNEIIMSCAVVAETGVATAVQEISGLLIARLNLLRAFIHSIDRAPTDLSRPNLITSVGGLVVNETALLTVEEVLNAAIGELAGNIPVVGIAASVINICLRVREKQEAFRERSAILEERTAAYIKRNATDDMWIELESLRRDDETVKDLLSLIDELIHQLRIN